MNTPVAVFLAIVTSCAPSAPEREPPRTPAAVAAQADAVAEQTRARPVDHGAGRPLTPAEADAFAPLLEAAERIRGLRFLRPVPTRVQSQSDIVAFVRARIEREDLERARIFYVALGLLPPDLDVERMILALMGEQVVGYYDADEGRMVVRDDVVRAIVERGDPASSPDALVLVHEYVHALQDQHLGLRSLQNEHRSIDAENALASLVEGDATLAMLGWVFALRGQPLSRLTRNPALVASLLASQPRLAGGAELDAAPAIVRAPLLSRYLDGLLFCSHLHGQGGFSAVNEGFRRLPESTEQILHPERYLRRERPEPVFMPALPELDAAGYVVHDEDTLGELEASVYFALGTGEDRDAAAAAGWAGDRIRVYVRQGTTAAVWFSTWDDEREAIEAEAAAARVRDRVPADRIASHLVRRSGRALLVVRDLDPALHAAVLDELERLSRALPARPGLIVDAR